MAILPCRLLVTNPDVIPAKAGTHFAATRAWPDGSRLSPGRHSFVNGRQLRSLANLHDQAADGIDLRDIAGIEHRRRRDLLDDRRPGDPVAGEERLALPHLAFDPAGSCRLEIRAARAAAGLGRRLALALRRSRQLGCVDE